MRNQEEPWSSSCTQPDLHESLDKMHVFGLAQYLQSRELHTERPGNQTGNLLSGSPNHLHRGVGSRGRRVGSEKAQM